MLSLGDRVKDSLSGFQGIVTGITNWYNGCQRVEVSSEWLHEGKPIDAQWLDVDRVELIEAGAKPPKTAPTGGPRDDPRAAADPSR